MIRQDSKTDASMFRIKNDAIKSIAVIAAKEIDGVVGTKPGILSNVFGFICKCQGREGVRLSFKENEIKVSISIIVKYGSDLQAVASNVQDKVKLEIEKMTGLNNIEVNVNIVDIVRG